MELQAHPLTVLFDQLGLMSDDASIEKFIAAHPLDKDTKLSEAEFWSDTQKKFLKQALMDDSDWAPVVDELNDRLHPAG
jgi:hypothetical protein